MRTLHTAQVKGVILQTRELNINYMLNWESSSVFFPLLVLRKLGVRLLISEYEIEKFILLLEERPTDNNRWGSTREMAQTGHPRVTPINRNSRQLLSVSF